MAEISPLRRRMIEDMTLRNLSPAKQRSAVADNAPMPDAEPNRDHHPVGPDPRRCPCCGGAMVRLGLVPRRIDSS